MKISRILLGLAASLAMAAASHAANFSFTGTFDDDDDVQLFSFTVGAPSTVTLRTWSYAGGVNAAGDTIARGGFDPILALFDSSGLLINQNDDGGFGLVEPDAVTGAPYDTFLSSALAPGEYTVSVMQYANFANGPNLSDGFSGSGTTDFQDAAGDFRTGAWAFDVLNVEQASTPSVPEGGGAWLLLGMGMGAVVLTKRLSGKAS